MSRSNQAPADTPREATRYTFAIPMTIELSSGLFRRRDTVDAVLVDLSQGGAAIITMFDDRLREKRRYRVNIDDHSGIVQVRNAVRIEGGRLRLGVQFKNLGLELQELVADSLEHAVVTTSRLHQIRDPFFDAPEQPVAIDAA